MKRLLAVFVFGVVAGGGLIFGAQRYHLVRAQDGVYLVPKLESTFQDAYVDVRQFGLRDWADHKLLTTAIIKAKKEHLMQDSAASDLNKGMNAALDGLIRK